MKDMRYRCNNPNCNIYEYYGARGIECRIDSVEDLVGHIGLPPPGYQLDRVDNDGHYEKGNVRWVDITTNNANRRPSSQWVKRPRLTEDVVLKIVELARRGIKHSRVAQIFNTSRTNVSNIMNGRSWSNITGIGL